MITCFVRIITETLEIPLRLACSSHTHILESHQSESLLISVLSRSRDSQLPTFPPPSPPPTHSAAIKDQPCVFLDHKNSKPQLWVPSNSKQSVGRAVI